MPRKYSPRKNVRKKNNFGKESKNGFGKMTRTGDYIHYYILKYFPISVSSKIYGLSKQEIRDLLSNIDMYQTRLDYIKKNPVLDYHTEVRRKNNPNPARPNHKSPHHRTVNKDYMLDFYADLDRPRPIREILRW
jgi:hypothetical protein